ncbi:hypothetical protein [Mesorhizobium sp.]|uniref:hypothetical protein n=1 Tax=Mesorhizobium sp. TaxID=1871066 RepID=UPI000FEA9BD9|nr:hypothetical protein [Mesorhizobium sp.]RWO22196.1 MAG: hypothetical protein EOS09_21410 [Mesorhizobium sp.]
MASETIRFVRRAILALELLDPFTGEPIYREVKLTAWDKDGVPVAGQPVVNLSRRFVWWNYKLRGDDQPVPGLPENPIARIRVAPPSPYGPLDVDLEETPPVEGLVSRFIPIDPSYRLPAGVTAIAGSLVEGDMPVAGATVSLAWIENGSAPLAGVNVPSGVSLDKGQFLAATRAMPNRLANLGEGPRARVFVTRASERRQGDHPLEEGKLNAMGALDWATLEAIA